MCEGWTCKRGHATCILLVYLRKCGEVERISEKENRNLKKQTHHILG